MLQKRSKIKNKELERTLKNLLKQNPRKILKIENQCILADKVIKANLKKVGKNKEAQQLKIDKHNEEYYLGKKKKRRVKQISKLFASKKGVYDKIAKNLKIEQEKSLEHELLYKYKWRLITEKWKRAIVKKFPISVSFKVHNYSALCSRVVQVIPNCKQRKSKFLKTENFLIDLEEEKKLSIRQDMQYNGWAFEEIVELAFLNVVNTINHDFFVKIILEHFPNKSMGEVMEVFGLIKKPCNIRFYKIEWKKAKPEAKKEIEKEFKALITNFFLLKYFYNFPIDSRLSMLPKLSTLRITLDQLKELLG